MQHNTNLVWSLSVTRYGYGSTSKLNYITNIKLIGAFITVQTKVRSELNFIYTLIIYLSSNN